MKNTLVLKTSQTARIFVSLLMVFVCPFLLFAENATVHETPTGKSCRLGDVGGIPVAVLAGSPEEIGSAHARLLKEQINGISGILGYAAIACQQEKGIDLLAQIDGIHALQRRHIPERHLREMEALGQEFGDPLVASRIAHFTDLFHCSGIAAHGKATADGQTIHLRVLDYGDELVGLSSAAAVQVYVPDGCNAWVSVGFAGLVGTVTATNEKGLSIGEIGGYGSQDYDGLPMCLLMRRVMEECDDVRHAVDLIKSVRTTCEFHYILSDVSGGLAYVHTLAGQPPVIVGANERNEFLEGGIPMEELVWYTNKSQNRERLCKAVSQYYGKLDADALKEITKVIRLDGNLQDVIFMPKQQVLLFSYAGNGKPACDNGYAALDYGKILLERTGK